MCMCDATIKDDLKVSLYLLYFSEAGVNQRGAMLKTRK